MVGGDVGTGPAQGRRLQEELALPDRTAAAQAMSGTVSPEYWRVLSGWADRLGLTDREAGCRP